MNMLIVPGGGSVYAERYKPIYKLLIDESKKRGYKEIKIARYPGQMDETGKITGKGDWPGAFEVVSGLIQQFADKDSFRIIARSFGCIVTLLAVKEAGTTNLEKISLWGPIPFWLVWKMFKNDFNASYDIFLRKGGVDISEDYFDTEEPIEHHLLEAIDNVPINISTGTEDNDCPPSFFNYLKEICVDKENIHFAGPVKGAVHSIRSGDPCEREYLDTLFGD
jgi:hypothetical protein